MKKLILLFLLSCSAFANAYEVKKVCASSQSNFNWTRSQAIQVHVHYGMDLHQQYGYNSAVKGYKYYVLIPWKNNKSTFVELESPYTAGMMMFNTVGTDTTGRKWRFSDNTTGYCI